MALLGGCSPRQAPVIPDTALGKTATEWLFAHNRGDGHAVVHFTTRNRGGRRMSPAEEDSTVLAGVTASKQIGHLTPTAVVVSSDALLVLRMQSDSTGVWQVRFSPAPPTSTVRVRVQAEREAPGVRP